MESSVKNRQSPRTTGTLWYACTSCRLMQHQTSHRSPRSMLLNANQRREFLTQPTQTHGLPKPIGLWVGLGELRISWVGLGGLRNLPKKISPSGRQQTTARRARILGLGGSWAPFQEARGFWPGLGWEFHEYRFTGGPRVAHFLKFPSLMDIP